MANFSASWNKACVWNRRTNSASLTLVDLYLAYVLCMAGLAKLRSINTSRLELDQAGVPVLITGSPPAVAIAMGLIEIFIAVTSLAGRPSRMIVRTARSCLFTIFCLYRIRAFKSSSPCSCFGPKLEVVSGYDVGVAIFWCVLSIVGASRGKVDTSVTFLSHSDRIK